MSVQSRIVSEYAMWLASFPTRDRIFLTLHPDLAVQAYFRTRHMESR